jgi:hypothetical protein
MPPELIGFVWYGLSSCSQTLLQCSLSTSMFTAALKSRENIVLHPGHWMTLNEHEDASRTRRACRSAQISVLFFNYFYKLLYVVIVCKYMCYFKKHFKTFQNTINKNR